MSEMEIPAEWILQPLSSLVAKFESGTSVNSEDRACGADEIGVLKTSSVNGGRFEPNENKVVLEKFEIQRAELNPRQDSILISRMNTFDLVGESAYVCKNFPNLFVPDRLWQTVMRNDPETSVKWLSYILRSPSFRHSVSNAATGTSGSMKNISQSSYLAIKILLPPLPHQRKIAKILTSVDNLIDKTESLIAKYQSIKQGMMHDLFTRGVDAKGKLRPPQSAAPELYKQSELGWIPKEWEVGKIGDIACLIGGFAFSSTLVRNSGVRWMKISNVGFEEIVWDESSYLPERLLKEQHDFVLKRGDIVMAMTRPIIRGKLKIAFVQKHDTPSLLNQRVGKFVIHNLDDNYFAYFAVQFSETVQQLEFKMLGTDPPNLSSSHIESVKLPLPSQSERKMQGEIIAVIDRKIKKERQSLNFYLSIKTALMQDLLSGKVQVTPDEIDKETAQLNAYLKELGV